jgi:anaerobic C4-dicarboxylate transporter DcuA
MVCIPATVIGVIVGIIFVYKRGKELDKDPEFLGG